MRDDLLALTADDLALLANRGLARRAQQEVAAGELTCELDEAADGTVTARWSDGVTCELPGGRPAAAARCSCPATAICRHVLRTVLAYQALRRPEGGGPAPAEPWDPGAIDDERLAQAVSRAALAWAGRALAEGLVAELVRAAKPTATLHSLGCTVRFLVPGDARYTHCGCAESAPCRHVPLAVWAFRRLDPARAGGVVEVPSPTAPSHAPLLGAVEAAVRELALEGVAGAPQELAERLRRAEAQCRAAGLAWPADALAELAHEHAAYAARDARFDPARVAALVGELAMRVGAGRSGGAPQLFVLGSASDGEVPVGLARLVGLGLSARARRGGVDLAAYLQDSDSGAAVAVVREVDEEPGADSPLWRLADAHVVRGVRLAALAAGQALVRGGRRLPSARLLPARARVTLNPQSYAWESLRAPLLAEDAAELVARLAAQPPHGLRPRRVTDGLHVCAVAGVAGAAFSAPEQAVVADARDSRGALLRVAHPYRSRGRAGAEALLAALAGQGEGLRFVAGHARLTPAGPVIAPTALVFEEGGVRRALLPWAERESPGAAQLPPPAPRGPGDPLADYWGQVEAALADLLVVGVRRVDARAAARWRELSRAGGALGFVRLREPVERLASACERRMAALGWDPAAALAAALDLALLAQVLAAGLGGESV